jgi:hypothetical protein
MALFFERMRLCAQKVLDTTDIVRETSRVETRRRSFSLPVDSRLGFRLVTSVRFGWSCFLFSLIEPD